jgi:hypothetical protein
MLSRPLPGPLLHAGKASIVHANAYRTVMVDAMIEQIVSTKSVNST